MAKKNTYKKVMTGPFRISFPNLGEAKAIMGQGDPKFGMKMLFPKNASGKDKELLDNIRNTCKEVAMEYWENKIPPNLKKPFRDGDTESDYPEDAGHWIASARTTKRPGVVDQKNFEYKTKEEIEKLIYGGCWCRATLLVGATESGGSRCVHLVLQNIQKLKDDAPFGNRKAAVDEFEPVEVSEAAIDFNNDTF